MKYNVIWLLLEILVHFLIYYFKLQGTFIGEVLFLYRYIYIVFIAIILYVFFKKNDINEVLKIIFYLNMIYLIFSLIYFFFS